MTAARILFSVLSMVPALVVLAAFGGSWWGRACAVAAAVEPVTAFFGLHVLPAAPAAALVSVSLLMAHRRRAAAAGFLLGCAALFRGEVLLALPLCLFLGSDGIRERVRPFARLAVPAFLAVLPVMVVNIAAGAGPVLSVNGAENLWLGTDWELASTPPGVEFEALMHLDSRDQSPDSHFLALAVRGIGADPAGWLLKGLRKTAAALSVPGPGRNLELGVLLHRTGLFPLLAVTLLFMSLAVVRLPAALTGSFPGRLAPVLLVTFLTAAFLFIPAARYRTALFPSVLFLASASSPSRREVPVWAAAAVLLALLSLVHHYPGAPRNGLTEVQAAQERLSRNDPRGALDLLHDASCRGYSGADLHNIAGASLMALDRPSEGIGQFEAALATTPDSPTLLRNYAVALWNSGRYDEALNAARRAVQLNPLLSTELEPVLARGGGGPR